jgi:hypothetical protein
MLGVIFIFVPAQKKSMRNASAKSHEMKVASNNNLPVQTDDVLFNPKNPVNPDSKPQATGIIYNHPSHLLKTCSNL